MGAETTDRVIATPLATTWEKSLSLQSILDDCRMVNFTYLLKKSEEDLSNYTMVGLTLVLGKIVEHVLWESISNM